MSEAWLNKVNWSEDGLVPAIAQDAATGRILMVAWMNREALRLTWQKNEAVYWSRSRKKLWHKGEEAGHIQQVKDESAFAQNRVMMSTEKGATIFCNA